jgi:hypothetical protein
MRKAVVGTLGAAAVVTGIFIGVKTLSDEPPIRVRNGSIEVFAGVEDGTAWLWEAEDGDADEDEPSFSHEPNHLHPEFGKDLWIKVVPVGSPGAETYECRNNVTTGSARMVFVDFTSGTSTVNGRLRRSRSGLINQRTKVRPKGAFTLDSTGTILKSAGDGFVTSVRVGSLECTFKKKESLDTIYICMTSSNTACQ